MGSKWLDLTAKNKGDYPEISIALESALQLSKSFIIGTKSLFAAQCNGVLYIYIILISFFV